MPGSSSGPTFDTLGDVLHQLGDIAPERVRTKPPLPGRALPRKPVPGLGPDLAVEVLSEGNTAGEMQRKLKDSFIAGVRLVRFVDPRRRTGKVFTSPEEGETLTEEQTLNGGEVLPGLRLSGRDVFARVPPRKNKSPARKRRARGEGSSG